MNVLDIPVRTIDGDETTLRELGDGPVLVANVASRCGLAGQFEKLERIAREDGPRGLAVVGVPSNQFLQEPGGAERVKTACSMTYGVTFPLLEKARLNGRSQHPLFAELTKAADADGVAGRVKWNFEKFLVHRDGRVERFRSRTEPDDPAVRSAIEAAIAG